MTIDIVTVADPESRTLWWGSHRARGPRRDRTMRGATLYVDDSVTDADLLRAMRPGDVAYGPAPGAVSAMEIACGRGSYNVVRARSWGVESDDPNEAARQIASTFAAIDRAEIPRGRTAAGTARRMLEAAVGPAPGLRGDVERMCRAAIHGGPAVAVGGGQVDAVCLDLREAYLSALRVGDVSTVGRVQRVRGWKPGQRGIVEATVYVAHPRQRIGWLAPLPVREKERTTQPVGIVRGVWLSDHLSAAIETGTVSVIEVCDAVTWADDGVAINGLATKIDGIPNKRVRRLLYTRIYGACASDGTSWEGRTHAAGEMPEWRMKIDGRDAPPTRRPDLAAVMTGGANAALVRAQSQLDWSLSVAWHVDSVITGDVAGAMAIERAEPERWQVKARAPVRCWGAGRWRFRPDRATSADSWLRSTKPTIPDEGYESARAWLGGVGCWQSPDAESVAPNGDGHDPSVRAW